MGRACVGSHTRLQHDAPDGGLHAGKPVSHTKLLRQVWGEYAVGDKYNARYVVAQIRKKLGDDPANPWYIVNEPGVGYRLLG